MSMTLIGSLCFTHFKTPMFLSKDSIYANLHADIYDDGEPAWVSGKWEPVLVLQTALLETEFSDGGRTVCKVLTPRGVFWAYRMDLVRSKASLA